MKGGNMRRILFFCFFFFLIFLFSYKKEEGVLELKRYSLDSMEGVITLDNIQVDKENSFDGNGSLKITVQEPTTIRLFETGKMDVENAKLIYQAKLKCEGLEGQAYIEMWCSFTGKGEFFSRGLQNVISGNLNWSSAETPFFLEKNQKPDNVKLNLVINGKGTVWIDDIRLLKAPLK